MQLRPNAGGQGVGEAEEGGIVKLAALAQQVRAGSRGLAVAGQRSAQNRDLVAIKRIQRLRARRGAQAGVFVVVQQKPIIHLQPRQQTVGFGGAGEPHHLGHRAGQAHRRQPFDAQGDQAGRRTGLAAHGRDCGRQQEAPGEIMECRRFVAGRKLGQQPQQAGAVRARPHIDAEAAHRPIENATGIEIQFAQFADFDAGKPVISAGAGLARFVGQGGRRGVQRRRRAVG